MKRCLSIVSAAACLAASVVCAAETRPNILWITAEDMSPNLGCYGDAYADTPHIDQLAAQGTRFTRFFAESPMCAPSRATIITGMHNGPLGASQMRSNHRVPSFVRPFTAWLREAGYYCANNEKTDYNLARDASGGNAEFIREGWDESGPRAHWRKRSPGQPFFCVLNYMDTHQSRASRDSYAQFVEKVQSRLPAGRIHDPAKAPLPPHYSASDTARRTVARYYDCISTLDDFVGKTLADLRADGLAEDTIVFFYSDHGAGLPTGKAFASNFGLHCPLIVHVPEKFRHLAPGGRGEVNERLACFADLAPTVLHLAGLPVPEHMHGRPFLGAKLGPAPEFVLGTRDRMDETLETTRWITDGRHLLVRAYRRDSAADQQSLTSRYNGHGELCQEIRTLVAGDRLTTEQRALWSAPRAGVRLFDLREDRWNLRDIAASQPQRAAEMERALEEFMLRERDLGLWPEPELADAERDASAHELARRDPARYPLERLIETAKLTDAAALRARLADEHFAIRRWAVIGLAALGDEARSALSEMKPLLGDPAASVRIEAAHLIASLDDGDSCARALDVLVTELDSANTFAAAESARALELLGDKARPKLAEMRRALRERADGFEHKPKGPRPAHYGLEFSLLTALERFGETTDHTTPTFERNAFPLSQGIWGVDALDANGDGKLDFIAAGETKVWAMLAPDWRVVELADTPGGRTIHAIALDGDGDGDLDLALGRSASDFIRHREALAAGKPSKEPVGEDWTVAWLENTGRTDAPWPLHQLDRELHGVHGVWRGDVNRDGKPDLLANSFAGPHLESSLAWFATPFAKDAPIGSLRRMVTTGKATGRPHYMDFADMNRDGRGDVLLGATAEGSFTWWEQPADLAQEWKRHVIAMEPGGSHPRATDLNGDGQLDVIGSTGHGIGVFWYEAPSWTRHVIDADLRDVHAFDATDLDGDGDIDAAGCSFSAKVVRWWENIGGGKFIAHDIDTTNDQQAYDLKITDLDGDGRKDLLLAGRQSKNAVWYRQNPASSR
jgi:uncharacterized sulfatase